MALLPWSADMCVGVEEIDTQHKKLVSLLNQLHDTMQHGGKPEEVGQVFVALVDYTRMHFSAEERIWDRGAYPGVKLHKLEHQRLTATVLDLQRQFQSGKGAVVTIETMQFLKRWLTDHILKQDKQGAAFLRSKVAGGSSPAAVRS